MSQTKEKASIDSLRLGSIKDKQSPNEWIKLANKTLIIITKIERTTRANNLMHYQSLFNSLVANVTQVFKLATIEYSDSPYLKDLQLRKEQRDFIRNFIKLVVTCRVSSTTWDVQAFKDVAIILCKDVRDSFRNMVRTRKRLESEIELSELPTIDKDSCHPSLLSDQKLDDTPSLNKRLSTESLLNEKYAIPKTHIVSFRPSETSNPDTLEIESNKESFSINDLQNDQSEKDIKSLHVFQEGNVETRSSSIKDLYLDKDKADRISSSVFAALQKISDDESNFDIGKVEGSIKSEEFVNSNSDEIELNKGINIMNFGTSESEDTSDEVSPNEHIDGLSDGSKCSPNLDYATNELKERLSSRNSGSNLFKDYASINSNETQGSSISKRNQHSKEEKATKYIQPYQSNTSDINLNFPEKSTLSQVEPEKISIKSESVNDQHSDDINQNCLTNSPVSMSNSKKLISTGSTHSFSEVSQEEEMILEGSSRSPKSQQGDISDQSNDEASEGHHTISRKHSLNSMKSHQSSWSSKLDSISEVDKEFVLSEKEGSLNSDKSENYEVNFKKQYLSNPIYKPTSGSNSQVNTERHSLRSQSSIYSIVYNKGSENNGNFVSNLNQSSSQSQSLRSEGSNISDKSSFISKNQDSTLAKKMSEIFSINDSDGDSSFRSQSLLSLRKGSISSVSVASVSTNSIMAVERDVDLILNNMKSRSSFSITSTNLDEIRDLSQCEESKDEGSDRKYSGTSASESHNSESEDNFTNDKSSTQADSGVEDSEGSENGAKGRFDEDKSADTSISRKTSVSFVESQAFESNEEFKGSVSFGSSVNSSPGQPRIGRISIYEKGDEDEFGSTFRNSVGTRISISSVETIKALECASKRKSFQSQVSTLSAFRKAKPNDNKSKRKSFMALENNDLIDNLRSPEAQEDSGNESSSTRPDVRMLKSGNSRKSSFGGDGLNAGVSDSPQITKSLQRNSSISNKSGKSFQSNSTFKAKRSSYESSRSKKSGKSATSVVSARSNCSSIKSGQNMLLLRKYNVTIDVSDDDDTTLFQREAEAAAMALLDGNSLAPVGIQLRDSGICRKVLANLVDDYSAEPIDLLEHLFQSILEKTLEKNMYKDLLEDTLNALKHLFAILDSLGIKNYTHDMEANDTTLRFDMLREFSLRKCSIYSELEEILLLSEKLFIEDEEDCWQDLTLLYISIIKEYEELLLVTKFLLNDSCFLERLSNSLDMFENLNIMSEFTDNQKKLQIQIYDLISLNHLRREQEEQAKDPRLAKEALRKTLTDFEQWIKIKGAKFDDEEDFDLMDSLDKSNDVPSLEITQSHSDHDLSDFSDVSSLCRKPISLIEFSDDNLNLTHAEESIAKSENINPLDNISLNRRLPEFNATRAESTKLARNFSTQSDNFIVSQTRVLYSRTELIRVAADRPSHKYYIPENTLLIPLCKVASENSLLNEAMADLNNSRLEFESDSGSQINKELSSQEDDKTEVEKTALYKSNFIEKSHSESSNSSGYGINRNSQYIPGHSFISDEEIGSDVLVPENIKSEDDETGKNVIDLKLNEKSKFEVYKNIMEQDMESPITEANELRLEFNTDKTELNKEELKLANQENSISENNSPISTKNENQTYNQLEHSSEAKVYNKSIDIEQSKQEVEHLNFNELSTLKGEADALADTHDGDQIGSPLDQNSELIPLSDETKENTSPECSDEVEYKANDQNSGENDSSGLDSDGSELNSASSESSSPLYSPLSPSQELLINEPPVSFDFEEEIKSHNGSDKEVDGLSSEEPIVSKAQSLTSSENESDSLRERRLKKKESMAKMLTTSLFLREISKKSSLSLTSKEVEGEIVEPLRIKKKNSREDSSNGSFLEGRASQTKLSISNEIIQPSVDYSTIRPKRKDSFSSQILTWITSASGEDLGFLTSEVLSNKEILMTTNLNEKVDKVIYNGSKETSSFPYLNKSPPLEFVKLRLSEHLKARTLSPVISQGLYNTIEGISPDKEETSISSHSSSINGGNAEALENDGNVESPENDENGDLGYLSSSGESSDELAGGVSDFSDHEAMKEDKFTAQDHIDMEELQNKMQILSEDIELGNFDPNGSKELDVKDNNSLFEGFDSKDVTNIGEMHLSRSSEVESIQDKTPSRVVTEISTSFVNSPPKVATIALETGLEPLENLSLALSNSSESNLILVAKKLDQNHSFSQEASKSFSFPMANDESTSQTEENNLKELTLNKYVMQKSIQDVSLNKEESPKSLSPPLETIESSKSSSSSKSLEESFSSSMEEENMVKRFNELVGTSPESNSELLDTSDCLTSESEAEVDSGSESVDMDEGFDPQPSNIANFDLDSKGNKSKIPYSQPKSIQEDSLIKDGNIPLVEESSSSDESIFSTSVYSESDLNSEGSRNKFFESEGYGNNMTFSSSQVDEITNLSSRRGSLSNYSDSRDSLTDGQISKQSSQTSLSSSGSEGKDIMMIDEGFDDTSDLERMSLSQGSRRGIVICSSFSSLTTAGGESLAESEKYSFEVNPKRISVGILNDSDMERFNFLTFAFPGPPSKSPNSPRSEIGDGFNEKSQGDYFIASTSITSDSEGSESIATSLVTSESICKTSTEKTSIKDVSIVIEPGSKNEAFNLGVDGETKTTSVKENGDQSSLTKKSVKSKKKNVDGSEEDVSSNESDNNSVTPIRPMVRKLAKADDFELEPSSAAHLALANEEGSITKDSSSAKQFSTESPGTRKSVDIIKMSGPVGINSMEGERRPSMTTISSSRSRFMSFSGILSMSKSRKGNPALTYIAPHGAEFLAGEPIPANPHYTNRARPNGSQSSLPKKPTTRRSSNASNFSAKSGGSNGDTSAMNSRTSSPNQSRKVSIDNGTRGSFSRRGSASSMGTYDPNAAAAAAATAAAAASADVAAKKKINRLSTMSGIELTEEVMNVLKHELTEEVMNVLKHEYGEEEIKFRDGVIVQASIRALVERLTLHDSSIDSSFIETFLLTFRSFCKPILFLDHLIERFDLLPPKGVSDEALEVWRTHKQTAIRIRVNNILKIWLDSYFYVRDDGPCLEKLINFANNSVMEAMPSVAKRLLVNCEKLLEKYQEEAADNKVTGSKQMDLMRAAAMAKLPNIPPPLPNIPKGIAKSLITLLPFRIVDLEPMEVARQLTIMDCKSFCEIRPHELIGLEFSKKASTSVKYVRIMTDATNEITSLICDCILKEPDLKKRCNLMKYFIRIGENLLILKNYNSLMPIVGALNSSMIARLKKTWALLPPKFKLIFEQLRKSTDHSKNYADYRNVLKTSKPPCLPFLGLYLTDLTFTDEGNAAFQPGTDDAVRMVNFAKYARTVAIVQEIQKFQVPYNLIEVKELQERIKLWMTSSNERWDEDEFYDLSLALEPRDNSQPKLTVRSKSQIKESKDKSHSADLCTHAYF